MIRTTGTHFSTYTFYVNCVAPEIVGRIHALFVRFDCCYNMMFK